MCHAVFLLLFVQAKTCMVCVCACVCARDCVGSPPKKKQVKTDTNVMHGCCVFGDIQFELRCFLFTCLDSERARFSLSVRGLLLFEWELAEGNEQIAATQTYIHIYTTH
jgi:hypothetical protein